MKLNIGCGMDMKEGYINIDSHNMYGATVMDIFNMEYYDNKIDEILLYHILEDFTNCHELLDECIRVLKKKGILRIRVPSETGTRKSIYHNKPLNVSAFRSYFNGEANYGKGKKGNIISYKYISERNATWWSKLCARVCNICGWVIVDNTIIKNMFPSCYLELEVEKC